jgi:hypothetical protein
MDSYEQAFQNGIDLYGLPRRGKKQIDFINSAGCPIKIYKEYENGKIIDLTVVIEHYDKKTRKVYFVGYEKGIYAGDLIEGHIGTIFISIAITHPDKVPFFVNTDDAYKYTAGSTKKALFICPICGQTHEMVIKDFIKNGFTCPNKNCPNNCNYKRSEAKKGKQRSEETKQKISKARIGKYAGENHPMYGRTGENSPNWQGGSTPIQKHLRDIIDPFMKVHKKALNKTCEVTGKKGEDSHHIYPFTNIVHDAHNKNNITIKPNVGDYTPEELKALEDYVLSWHVIGDWSNMILLAEDVHDQLHNSEFYKNMQNKYDPTLTYEAAHKFIEEFKITWSSVAA